MRSSSFVNKDFQLFQRGFIHLFQLCNTLCGVCAGQHICYKPLAGSAIVRAHPLFFARMNASMETYKIKVFPEAKQDMEDIVSCLNIFSPDVALRYYDLLVEEIASLAQMPERRHRPKDIALAAKGYRYLIVKNYLVFYVVEGDTVQIRRIPYARRNYQALL